MSEVRVWGHLCGAKTMIEFADAETKDLDRLTFELGAADEVDRRRNDVWRTYVSWLTFSRQVAVSVDKAGRAAGRPKLFQQWWAGLAEDPVHDFFRQERNAALKEVARVVESQRIDDAQHGVHVAYWVFPHGPHAGDP